MDINFVDSGTTYWSNESNDAVAGDGALVRKRSCELVIHITSIGEFSFLFYFTIFPHLQFTAREFRILYCLYRFFLVFILN